MTHPERELEIAVVGKYVALHDAYMSVKESLIHACAYHQRQCQGPVDPVGVGDARKRRGAVSPVLMESSFPARFQESGGSKRKIIVTARYARERLVPYLGLCLGMQVMVVEFARFAFGTEGCELDRVCSADLRTPVISSPVGAGRRQRQGRYHAAVSGYPCPA